MQEKDRRPHYSDQWGHATRGFANRFREKFGVKPVTFSPGTIFLAQIDVDRRRTMRRVTRTGR